MIGLRRKKPAVESQHDTRVEVVVHQQATQKVVDEAKQSNKRLLNALEPNHITIKLFVAAGGSLKHVNGGK